MLFVLKKSYNYYFSINLKQIIRLFFILIPVTKVTFVVMYADLKTQVVCTVMLSFLSASLYFSKRGAY